eukprot:4332639-Pyramimonas_sp.AAC.1
MFSGRRSPVRAPTAGDCHKTTPTRFVVFACFDAQRVSQGLDNGLRQPKTEGKLLSVSPAAKATVERDAGHPDVPIACALRVPIASALLSGRNVMLRQPQGRPQGVQHGGEPVCAADVRREHRRVQA